MNEEVSDKTVRVAVETLKLTARVLARKLYHWKINQERKSNMSHTDEPPTGKQTVKQLIGQGQGASTMVVSGDSVRDFKRCADKYGVDFAIVKDKGSNPPRFTCFFKAKDIDAITKVVAEYSAKVMKKQTRKASIVKQLHQLKAEIAKIPRKVHQKVREVMR